MRDVGISDIEYLPRAARKEGLCQVGGLRERIGKLRTRVVAALIGTDPRDHAKVRVERAIELLVNRPKSF